MFSSVDQELGPILGGARVQSVCAVSAWDGSCGVLCAEERELACVPRSSWMRGSSCCELRGLGRFGTSGAAVGGQCGGCVCAAATCSEGCFMGLFAAQTGCGSSPKSAWIRRTRGYPGYHVLASGSGVGSDSRWCTGTECVCGECVGRVMWSAVCRGAGVGLSSSVALDAGLELL